MAKKFTIFALSDATGELAHNLAAAAVNQFPTHHSEIVKVPRITDADQILSHVLQAQQCLGVIMFTFVKPEMRREILDLAKKHQVVAIDILGPVLDSLSNYFHTLPSDEPGLQYKQTQQYFKRVEALEFSVKHDDGQGLETLTRADIVILGVSRTSKTPLSVFLAYQGYCCANLPVVPGIPLPKELDDVDPTKIVGLTIDEKRLSVIRSTRLSKLGRSDEETYSNQDKVKDELAEAARIYRERKIPIINITGKAIEEIASEVRSKLKI